MKHFRMLKGMQKACGKAGVRKAGRPSAVPMTELLIKAKGGTFARTTAFMLITAMVAALFTFGSVLVPPGKASAADGAVTSFNDIQPGSAYAEAIARVADIGIISGDGSGAFNPQAMVTREQFAKIIVVTSKLEGQVNAQQGIRIFSDVDPNGWSGGYINVAWANKLISSVSTWEFNPYGNILFEYVCLALVRVLNYGDTDVFGQWPDNYIKKASDIGLLDGITLRAGDSVSREVLAAMITRLLDTKMKSSTPATAPAYAESKGLYTPCIILVNSATSEKMATNQVITDKGTYFLSSVAIDAEVGKKYGYVIVNDTVTKAYNLFGETESLVVESILENRITYRPLADGKALQASASMVLPDKTTYYYNGAKVSNYDSLKNIISTCSKIVFSYNTNRTGYEYAIIIDPIYSSAKVVRDYYGSDSVQGIDVSGSSGVPIIKDGTYITKENLMENDVIYQVSDIGESCRYVIAFSDRVEGIITAILPNKLSPQTIAIGGKNYAISKDMDISSVTAVSGSFSAGDQVTALLGHDGKIVALAPRVLETGVIVGAEFVSKYAFVISTSSKLLTTAEEYGRTAYYAKVLLDTGAVKTYRTPADCSTLKGLLVEYTLSLTDSTAAVLNEPGKAPPSAAAAPTDQQNGSSGSGTMTAVQDSSAVLISEAEWTNHNGYYVNKEIYRFDKSFASENTIIFNMINRGAGDTEVKLIKWNDMPAGTIPWSKVVNVVKEGDFDEITVLSLYDIFDQRQKTAVIKSAVPQGMNQLYTLMIDGSEYKYTATAPVVGAAPGAALQVQFAGGQVIGIDRVKVSETAQANTIQALDLGRIRAGGKTYAFKSNIHVYRMTPDNVVTRIGILDLDTAKTYMAVSVYLDKEGSPDGLVEAIVVIEPAPAAE